MATPDTMRERLTAAILDVASDVAKEAGQSVNVEASNEDLGVSVDQVVLP